MSKQTAKDQPLSPITLPKDVSQSKFIDDLASATAKHSAGWFFEAGEDSLHFRRLAQEDYARGFLTILSQQTTVGDVNVDKYREQFDRLNQNPDYTVLVAEGADGRIVGCATLLLEHKFIHACGVVGHIEDVVVDEMVRRKGLGHGLVDCLVKLSEKQACYKVMQDCNEKNVSFYEHCGFQRHSNHLALYFH